MQESVNNILWFYAFQLNLKDSFFSKSFSLFYVVASVLFLFTLSHRLGLAKVNRLILLITSVRGSDHRQGTHRPDPVFDTRLLHVPSDTARQVLQIISRSHVHKEKGDKEK